MNLHFKRPLSDDLTPPYMRVLVLVGSLILGLVTPTYGHSETAFKVSLASNHFKPRNPAAHGCNCSRERFVEKNWGIGIERYTDYEKYRYYHLDGYLYTDSFGKPAGFIGRGREYRLAKTPIWLGFRYGLSSRHDQSDWIPIPFGYGTVTVKLESGGEIAFIIIPKVVVGFGLRLPLGD